MRPVVQDAGRHAMTLLNPSFSGNAMKNCLSPMLAIVCLFQAAGSAVAQTTAIDGNRSIGPAYTPDPSLTPRPEVPKGTVIEFKMDSIGSSSFPGQSQVTGAFSRRVWVYVPKQYIKGEKAPFMVSQDAFYRPWLTNLLDNALHDKKLPIMVIIFADNGGNANGIGFAKVQGTERNLEYDTVSARYGEWVQRELLPRVEAETRSQIPDQAVSLTSDPEGKGAIGCSSGAVAAFTMAWFQPDFFRRIISYSGSYTNLQFPTDPNYPHGAWSYPERLIKDSPKKPIRIWLEVGAQDLDWSQFGNFLDWQVANRAMASALKSKGYHYHFDVAQDARHCDGRVAAQTLPEAMQWLWKDYPIK
jgi:iron(III)-enterobactin esterase